MQIHCLPSPPTTPPNSLGIAVQCEYQWWWCFWSIVWRSPIFGGGGINKIFPNICSPQKFLEFRLSNVTFHICQMGEKHFRWVSPFPPWDVANPVTKSNFSVFFSSHFHFFFSFSSAHIYDMRWQYDALCPSPLCFLLKKRASTSLQSWYFRCCCIFCFCYAWQ